MSHILPLTVALFLLCSCATAPDSAATFPASDLPGDVPMNDSAGRWGGLFVTVQLANGEELPFLLDTGCSLTVFDKSLAGKVGKHLRTGTMSGWLGKEKLEIHEPPKLSLRGTPLILSEAGVIDLSKTSLPTAARGIVGMDTLSHYCVQLDFQARTIRFLDSATLQPGGLGQAFDLHFRRKIPYVRAVGFFSEDSSELMIDSGYDLDGHSNTLPTNQASSKRIQINELLWNGCNYTNLQVRHGSLSAKENSRYDREVLGLRFLSRHLVTFDFPAGKMYLKQTSIGPLATADVEIASRFLKSIQLEGRLPGWEPHERGTAGAAPDFTDTVALRKTGDTDIYYYKIKTSPSVDDWLLEKAWRTDKNDKLLEEYTLGL